MWNPLWLLTLLMSLQINHAPNPFSASDSYAAESVASPTVADMSSQLQGDLAAFGLTLGGSPVPYSVMAVFALPGESLPIEVDSADSNFEVRSDAGELESIGPHAWSWRAPMEVGAYPVQVVAENGASITANVFVMVPYERMSRGRVGGYRIGAYPQPRAGRGTQSPRPRGFVEVTAATESLWVAPHFRLGQFVCKAGAGFPKYVVLRPSLLSKLERLLEVAHENGADVESFQLMSAYRTPVYNLGIGNKTTFSRHQYGDAADIFIDESPANGRMDDLNGDGRETAADAAVLRGWAEQVEKESGLIGGLSAYGSSESHGPFVHVDARGYAARW